MSARPESKAAKPTGKVAKPDEDAWFVYDGECPLCARAARALEGGTAAGAVHRVNARYTARANARDTARVNVRGAPGVLAEIARRGLDLDDGMVLKTGGRFYHGADALHMAARLGLGGLGGVGGSRFARAVALLFRSRPMAHLCYPAMRGVRTLILKLKGVEKIGARKASRKP